MTSALWNWPGIAGFLHDIGNVVNRADHAQSGAIMAFQLLTGMGMPAKEIGYVVSAIGHHDEGTAFPVNAIAAAVILADKSDVRRAGYAQGELHPLIFTTGSTTPWKSPH